MSQCICVLTFELMAKENEHIFRFLQKSNKELINDRYCLLLDFQDFQ